MNWEPTMIDPLYANVLVARGCWIGRHGVITQVFTHTVISFVKIQQYTKAGTLRVDGEKLLIPLAFCNGLDAEVQRRGLPKRKPRAEVSA